MNVEQLAVNHVSTLIARCPRLTPYISSNDKTPFTDGHIDLYSDDSKTNDAAKGRIGVQVKGRVTTKAGSEIRHNVRVSDLRAYLNLSGVIYFVVALKKNSRKTTAYYLLLTPFRIQEILENLGPSQKRKSLTFSKLPKDQDLIEEIVELAVTAKVQNPSQGLDPALYEHIVELKIHGFGKIDFQKPMTFNLSRDDFVVIARTKGGMEIALPGSFQISPSSYLGEPLRGTVASADVEVIDPIWRRVEDGTIAIELSETLLLTLCLPDSKKLGGLNLQLSDRLDTRIRDIGFYLGCIDSGEFRINDETIKLTIASYDDVNEIRSHYRYLQKLGELFETLSVSTSLIDLSAITDAVSSQLWAIYQSLICGLPLLGEQDEQGRLLQPIGPWNLDLMLVKSDEGWRIFDTFANDLPTVVTVETESHGKENTIGQATAYDLLEAPQAARTLNLHLESIVSAYESIAESGDVRVLANSSVLRLIQAADIEPRRAQELLIGAEELNEWLISRFGDESIHQINRLQIYARLRELTESEQEALMEIRRSAANLDTNAALDLELSCAILLEDTRGISYITKKMDPSRLQNFQAWPIWNLRCPKTRKP